MEGRIPRRKALPLFGLAVLLFLFLPDGPAGAGFFFPDIRPGYGVTSRGWVSDYFPPLRGTNLDAPVFFLDSGRPGATALAIGGTHGQEIAGHTAAAVLIENVEVTRGRLIVIPCANRSALSVRDRRNRVDRFHLIHGRSGPRHLPYGDRLTDPADQGKADPEKYVHPSGHELKDGSESRNLNRAYPGKPDGTPTEQLAHAILELIRREKVDITLDMHETGTPEYYIDERGKIVRNDRLVHMLVCHPRGLEIGAMTLLELEGSTGVTGKLEKSDPSFRGFSHLEIGKATDCLSFLFETPNPGMDRWREKPDPVGDRKYPLERRVGTHLMVFKHLMESYGAQKGKSLVLKGLPDYPELTRKGVGAFLR